MTTTITSEGTEISKSEGTSSTKFMTTTAESQITTCRSARGQYYAVGDTWSPADEPCKKCSCHADGNATKTECVTRNCTDPPGPNCRPLIRQFQCCPYDWDCSDSYLITTPRKWVRGQEASICVFLLGSPDIRLNFSLKDDSEVVSQVNLEQTAASGHHCVNVTVPSNISYISALEISGEINNASIFEKRNLILASIMQTFIQTDKHLYMPGQLVRFRILTISGTKGLVSYEDIPEIWIMSPKSKRLTQWKNVPNPDGLLQLGFQLAEEVEEGTLPDFREDRRDKCILQSFKVKNMCWARFSSPFRHPVMFLQLLLKLYCLYVPTYPQKSGIESLIADCFTLSETGVVPIINHFYGVLPPS
ncbi:alpha-2-macroglobulin-like protein 1 [Macrobrachium rosenbergii]|uniref:alpha-2-macroglobulin-like protein 1 n=1 Tax=Macrobrachium rosenbergii TaxID=79674 RepID=UPI0034D5EE26